MKKQNSVYFALVIILIASQACNAGGTTTSPAAENPTAIPELGGTTPTVIPEPLPSGYMELLQNKIASGDWTQEVGLVTLLKMFAGEIQVSEAGLGEGVLEAEGTGILRLAGGYLQTGTDQAVKDELTRLLNLLVPSQEALDRYSISEDQASGRVPGLAAPARQDDEDCRLLWVNGFPDARTPVFPCFLRGGSNVAGYSYQVYYPLAWRGDASRDPYYNATLDAVLDSINKFQDYGGVKEIYFVFTTLADVRDTPTWTTYASTGTMFFQHETEACPIIINPAALALQIPEYKQAIAHEIFHCFQAWNLPEQLDGPGMDSRWWVEGTAEYFSNLVYPAVNAEHSFAAKFSTLSRFSPLTDMSYENFAFFQFLGGRIGPIALIAMLSDMPTHPGRDFQIAALAAVPEMEATFEEFVRSVLDNTLIDSDTGPINIPVNYTNEFLYTDISSIDFSGSPFVVARYKISFAGEKEFSVSSVADGAGRSAARRLGDPEAWAPIPESVRACGELGYVLYVITTIPAAVRTETIATTAVTEAPCDACLIGRWEATNESMLSYMQSVVSTGGEDVPTVESVTGVAFLEFNETGTGAGGYEDFKVHATGMGGNEGTEVFFTFQGQSSGPYTADGSALTGLSGGSDEMLVTMQILANGVSIGPSTVPIGAEGFPVGASVSTPYTCDGDTLTTWPPAEGVEPIEWIKVSP
jgi:hypothetical protein